MEALSVELAERSYAIKISAGLLDTTGRELKSLGPSPGMALVSNPTVFALYGQQVLKAINGAGYEPKVVIIPDGELYKDMHWAQYILGELLKHRLDRSSIVIALGGGVIGDITGFCASAYMRGVGFLQLPTTLLSQVDSSVGGKTGVNHPLGKNMIGAFWQPRSVIIDIDTLKTLDRRQLLCGLAEIIKYGVIWDDVLFDYLLSHHKEILSLDPASLTHIIKRSCQIKAEVVSKDEREGGLRAILNYGHTIGHAVETVSGYGTWLHGEAVAIGMYEEARLASRLGMLDKEAVSKIKELLALYGLPVKLPEGLHTGELLKAMEIDKKTVSGRLNFVLPTQIGSVEIVKDVERKKILALL